MAIQKPRGRVPEHDDKRRRRNKPVSYGAAEVETGRSGTRPQRLGITRPHFLIKAMWDALAKSAESKYYSDADWQRVRLELWYGNKLLTGGRIGSQAWAVFQSGLNELLVSPADKRRAGIELRPPQDDADEAAAVAQLDDYRAALGAG